MVIIMIIKLLWYDKSLAHAARFGHFPWNSIHSIWLSACGIDAIYDSSYSCLHIIILCIYRRMVAGHGYFTRVYERLFGMRNQCNLMNWYNNNKIVLVEYFFSSINITHFSVMHTLSTAPLLLSMSSHIFASRSLEGRRDFFSLSLLRLLLAMEIMFACCCDLKSVLSISVHIP